MQEIVCPECGERFYGPGEEELAFNRTDCIDDQGSFGHLFLRRSEPDTWPLRMSPARWKRLPRCWKDRSAHRRDSGGGQTPSYD